MRDLTVVTNKIATSGDLVVVSYLPCYMLHFDVKVGVVVNMSEDGAFFINRVDAAGKMIKNARSGWYDSDNVTILVENYLRGSLDGEHVYKKVPDIKSLIKEQDSVLEKVKRQVALHRKEGH